MGKNKLLWTHSPSVSMPQDPYISTPPSKSNPRRAVLVWCLPLFCLCASSLSLFVLPICVDCSSLALSFCLFGCPVFISLTFGAANAHVRRGQLPDLLDL